MTPSSVVSTTLQLLLASTQSPSTPSRRDLPAAHQRPLQRRTRRPLQLTCGKETHSRIPRSFPGLTPQTALPPPSRPAPASLNRNCNDNMVFPSRRRRWRTTNPSALDQPVLEHNSHGNSIKKPRRSKYPAQCHPSICGRAACSSRSPPPRPSTSTGLVCSSTTSLRRSSPPSSSAASPMVTMLFYLGHPPAQSLSAYFVPISSGAATASVPCSRLSLRGSASRSTRATTTPSSQRRWASPASY